MLFTRHSCLFQTVRIISLALIGPLLLAVFWQPTRWAEQRLQDVRMLYLSNSLEAHDKIAIVGITERTLSKFPYRSPVDRGLVADLLQAIKADGATAVMVDLLFDQPTEPNKDKRLQFDIEHFGIPLSVAYLSNDAHLTPQQQTFLNNFVPVQLRGSVSVLRDGFEGADRWIVPASVDGRNFSLSALIAKKLGKSVTSELTAIAWRSAENPFTEVPADILRWLPSRILKDKIVILGLTTSLDDRHRIPGVNDTAPGAVVQAQALATLLAEPPSPMESDWEFYFFGTLMLLSGIGIAARFSYPMDRVTILSTTVLLYYFLGFALWYELHLMIPLVLPGLLICFGSFLATSFLSFRPRFRQV